MKDFLYILVICILGTLLLFDSRHIRQKIDARQYLKKVDKREDAMSKAVRQLLEEVEEFRQTGAVPPKKEKITAYAIPASELNRIMMTYLEDLMRRDARKRKTGSYRNLELDARYVINPKEIKKSKKFPDSFDDIWGS